MRMTTTELTLQKELVRVRQRVSPGMLEELNDLNVDVFTDLLGDMVITLHAHVFSRRVADTTVRYPATWWDALKARWFPAWVLRRWPVRETAVTFTAHHDYPLLKIANQGPQLRVMRYEHTE